MLTRACAAVTWLRSERGPRASTLSALSEGTPSSRPDGTVPRSSTTGTLCVSSTSRFTVTRVGLKSSQLTPSARERTWTGRLCCCPARCMSYWERSTVAAKLSVVTGALLLLCWR